MKLVAHSTVIIGEKVDKISAAIPEMIEYISWSLTDIEANLYGQVRGNNITLQYNKEESFEVEFPFTDEFAIKNGMTCILTMLVMNYAIPVIQERIKKLYAVELRLQVKKGINTCSIIDDAYSSDFQSLSIALDFLEKHRSHTNKTVILSDIFHSGLEPKDLYQQVATLLKNYGISKVIGIGEEIGQYIKDFLRDALFCHNGCILAKDDGR